MSALLEEIADVAEKLRVEQRGFFTSSQGTPERARFMRASKALERRLDELIARRRGLKPPSEPPPQGDLFR